MRGGAFRPSSSPFRESGRLFGLLKEAGWFERRFSPFKESGLLLASLPFQEVNSGRPFQSRGTPGKLGARPPFQKGPPHASSNAVGWPKMAHREGVPRMGPKTAICCVLLRSDLLRAFRQPGRSVTSVFGTPKRRERAGPLRTHSRIQVVMEVELDLLDLHRKRSCTSRGPTPAHSLDLLGWVGQLLCSNP